MFVTLLLLSILGSKSKHFIPSFDLLAGNTISQSSLAVRLTFRKEESLSSIEWVTSCSMELFLKAKKWKYVINGKSILWLPAPRHCSTCAPEATATACFHFNLKDHSRYEVNTLGPLCLWQCFFWKHAIHGKSILWVSAPRHCNKRASEVHQLFLASSEMRMRNSYAC